VKSRADIRFSIVENRRIANEEDNDKDNNHAAIVAILDKQDNNTQEQQ
jgi:hypothetical protein